MEKTIGAFEIRRQLGKVLQDVAAKGDQFVVERHGEPVAAIVSMEVYQQWKKARGEFFARVREIAERANLPVEEAEKLASQAVEEAGAETSPK